MYPWRELTKNKRWVGSWKPVIVTPTLGPLLIIKESHARTTCTEYKCGSDSHDGVTFAHRAEIASLRSMQHENTHNTHHLSAVILACRCVGSSSVKEYFYLRPPDSHSLEWVRFACPLPAASRASDYAFAPHAARCVRAEDFVSRFVCSQRTQEFDRKKTTTAPAFIEMKQKCCFCEFTEACKRIAVSSARGLSLSIYSKLHTSLTPPPSQSQSRLNLS